MRSLAVLLSALCAAVIFSVFYSGAAAYSGQAGDKASVDAVQSKGPFITADNIYITRTCSGKIAGEFPETFIFGMHDKDGACSTMLFKADNYNEALGCAVKVCPDCDIEEITWLTEFSSSTPGLDAVKNYCPSRK